MSSQTNSMSESVVANTPARTQASRSHGILIAVGLAIGAVLGFGGNFLHRRELLEAEQLKMTGQRDL